MDIRAKKSNVQENNGSVLFLPLNRIFLLSFLFFSGVFYTQKWSPEKIDRLQDKIGSQYMQEGRIYEGIEQTKKAIQLSDEINYTKGRARGYIHMVNFLHSLGKYSEEQVYLQKAESLYNTFDDDPALLSAFFAAYGKNYHELGLIEKSNESFDKALKEALKIKDKQRKRKRLHYIYGSKAINFGLIEYNDSMYYYIHKAYKILPRVVEATNLTSYFLENKKNPDSAKFYLDQAEGLLKNSTETFDYLVFNYMSGQYYGSIKNYNKALEFYEKSLALSMKMNRPKNMMKNYKEIAEIYNLQNNAYKANEYLQKYTKIRDSFEKGNLIALQTSGKKIIDDEKKQSEELNKKWYYIIAGLFLGITILIVLLSVAYYRKVQKKDLLLKENTTAILQKDLQVKVLEQKVNETFDEIIQLAKENHPEFWGRFQEVYPDFRSKILSINPTLKVSELILAAYIYLGFNTKDIANYTFKAVQTIKNNKYNLRKRLNIPAQEDIVVWIRNQTDKEIRI
ncbi:tetratricopeptide repeat protein [Chryseobacterium bernardetii]|uniref:tetratricopeptide repeat protein n=1 Tax=Chryseobacterium bernardetii TaxID=1241978 RepID=UPI003AF8B2EA